MRYRQCSGLLSRTHTVKVLFVINSLGTGGAERSLSEMLPFLCARGIEVRIACLGHREEGVEEAVSGMYDVTFLTGRSLPQRASELRRLIKSERPDIVHSTIFESDLAARLAAIRLPCVVLTSLVNTSYEPERLADPNVVSWKLHATRLVDGLTARHLNDHFHAITKAVADSAVLRLGVDPAKITVVTRGRDRQRLGQPGAGRRRKVRARLGIDSEAVVLLNVGRQDYQKGHRDLLRAFAQVAAAHPETVLVQAGRRGHATAEMEQFLLDSSIADRVHLVGHRDDVPDLMAASDIFVFPSHYEGLGGAVIEAMALGLPVVVSRAPALLEVIEDGGNGLSAPVGDPRALAEAISTLVDDRTLREQFGRRSRKIFDEHFELSRSMRQMVAMYESLARTVPARLPTNSR